jgi:hypothetical protein
MSRFRIIIAFFILPFFTGCLYSVEFKPPYVPIEKDLPAPIDLRVSLSEISNCFLDRCQVKKGTEAQEVDKIFVAALQKENIFSEVLPMGSVADLKIEFIHFPDLDRDITKKEALHRDLLTLTGLGFITPLPFPFYIQTYGIARVSAEIEGEEYILKEYDFFLKSTIKSASIFGARYKRQELLKRGVMFVTPMFIDQIKLDYDFYQNLAKLFHAEDFETIKKSSKPGVVRTVPSHQYDAARYDKVAE